MKHLKSHKFNFEWTVWIPLLGLISMIFYTEFGRYRTIYFAGYIWKPYQILCFIGTLMLWTSY